MVSQLHFQKGKDAEVAWIDGQIVIRESQMDAKRLSADNEPMEGITLHCYYKKFHILIVLFFFVVDDEDTKVLTLEPLSGNVLPHETVFINELKLSEFKQALSKANIPAEVQAGVLLCCNGTIAVRRVCIYLLFLFLTKQDYNSIIVHRIKMIAAHFEIFYKIGNTKTLESVFIKVYELHLYFFLFYFFRLNPTE